MNRVILIVLDSVGVGALPDAKHFGDEGANTLGHIIERVNPTLTNMTQMGLGRIPNIKAENKNTDVGLVGRLMERSQGKDTTTGHWELMGVTLDKPFPTFPDGFPPAVMNAFEKAIGRSTLGNYATSGTAVLDAFGEEHLKTGYPIVYTSADSVFQIACHESIVPPKKLYEYCKIARELLKGDYAVGRVIARPFVGDRKGEFKRTGNRRDFSLEPTDTTLLDVMHKADLFTMGVGKIEDIFCHRGLVASDHASGNPACMEALFKALPEAPKGLLFVNLVDFDMIYGHRRDVDGYAKALEEFDSQIPKLKAMMKPDDLLLITADHGCDPTHTGTDHTREYIPLLAWHSGMTGITEIGTRDSYVDIAATIADLYGLPERFGGKSFKESFEV